jgi:MFS family permease
MEEPLLSTDDPVQEEPVRRASDATVFAICALGWFAAWPVSTAFFQLERGFATNCSIRLPRISNTDVADVSSISQLAMVLFIFVFGFTADRFGRRPTLLVSAATTVLGGIGMTLAPDWSGFLVGIVVSQGGLSFTVIIDAVMAEMISVFRREKALLFIGACTNLGLQYADIMRAALVPDTGPQHWRVLTGVLFAPAMMFLVSVALFLPESPVWLRSRAGSTPRPQSDIIIIREGDDALSLCPREDQPLSQSPAAPSTRLSAILEGDNKPRESFGTGNTGTSDHTKHDDSMQSSLVRWSDQHVDDPSRGSGAEVAASPQTAAGNLRALLCGESSGSTLWLIGMSAAIDFSATTNVVNKLTAIGSGHDISNEQLLAISSASIVAGVMGNVLPAVFVPKYMSVGKLFVLAIFLKAAADIATSIGIVHGKSDSRHALFVGVPMCMGMLCGFTYTGCWRVIVAVALPPSQRALGLSVLVAAIVLAATVGGQLQARLLDHVGIVPTTLVLNIVQVVVAVTCYNGHVLALGRSRGRADARVAAALADLAANTPPFDTRHQSDDGADTSHQPAVR